MLNILFHDQLKLILALYQWYNNDIISNNGANIILVGVNIILYAICNVLAMWPNVSFTPSTSFQSLLAIKILLYTQTETKHRIWKENKSNMTELDVITLPFVAKSCIVLRSWRLWRVKSEIPNEKNSQDYSYCSAYEDCYPFHLWQSGADIG